MLLKNADPLERYLVELVQTPTSSAGRASGPPASTSTYQQASVMAFHEFVGYLNEAFGAGDDYAVVHDLRIRCDVGRAHLDHVVITRGFDIFLVESRIAGDELRIDEEEEFTARYLDGARFRIRSPDQQLKRGEAVLQYVLRNIELPRRFGIKPAPRFHRYVVLPKGMSVANASGIGQGLFVHPKQLLRAVIGATREGGLKSLIAKATPEQLRDVGRIIVRWHTPDKVDFFRKYRAQPVPAA